MCRRKRPRLRQGVLGPRLGDSCPWPQMCPLAGRVAAPSLLHIKPRYSDRFFQQCKRRVGYPRNSTVPPPVPSAGSYESTLEVSPFSYFHAELYCSAENSIFPLQQRPPSLSFLVSVTCVLLVRSGARLLGPEGGPRFTVTDVRSMFESCAAASRPWGGISFVSVSLPSHSGIYGMILFSAFCVMGNRNGSYVALGTSRSK